MFSEELERRVPDARRLRVVSVHPGNVVVRDKGAVLPPQRAARSVRPPSRAETLAHVPSPPSVWPRADGGRADAPRVHPEGVRGHHVANHPLPERGAPPQRPPNRPLPPADVTPPRRRVAVNERAPLSRAGCPPPGLRARGASSSRRARRRRRASRSRGLTSSPAASAPPPKRRRPKRRRQKRPAAGAQRPCSAGTRAGALRARALCLRPLPPLPIRPPQPRRALPAGAGRCGEEGAVGVHADEPGGEGEGRAAGAGGGMSRGRGRRGGRAGVVWGVGMRRRHRWSCGCHAPGSGCSRATR